MTEQSDSSTMPSYPPPSAWVGWIAFAAAIMVMLGALHIFQGLVALFKDTYDACPGRGPRGHASTTPPGASCTSSAACSSWRPASACSRARSGPAPLGVIMAMISAILNVAIMDAFPFWSLTMVALDIVIILALTVHGREITPEG